MLGHQHKKTFWIANGPVYKKMLHKRHDIVSTSPLGSVSSGVDDPVGQKDFACALGIGFGQIVNQRDTTGSGTNDRHAVALRKTGSTYMVAESSVTPDYYSLRYRYATKQKFSFNEYPSIFF